MVARRRARRSLSKIHSHVHTYSESAVSTANIPVFGDAEWIGVLHEVDGHARLQASGSIDALDVKELAASILEGGREAFTRRREKYGYIVEELRLSKTKRQLLVHNSSL
jgi:hypothetical protein